MYSNDYVKGLVDMANAIITSLENVQCDESIILAAESTKLEYLERISKQVNIESLIGDYKLCMDVLNNTEEPILSTEDYKRMYENIVSRLESKGLWEENNV